MYIYNKISYRPYLTYILIRIYIITLQLYYIKVCV